jgi:hypothetical protein
LGVGSSSVSPCLPLRVSGLSQQHCGAEDTPSSFLSSGSFRLFVLFLFILLFVFFGVLLLTFFLVLLTLVSHGSTPLPVVPGFLAVTALVRRHFCLRAP